MFTPDFKKLRLVLVAGLVTATLWGLANLGLHRWATWAEAQGAHGLVKEDWLRYLLPSNFPKSEGRTVLLTGPSAVRENVLVERVGRAFPDSRVFQGAFSLATLDDVILSLQYIERTYGSESLPNVIVLGVTPRFVANIPQTTPFINGINRYSPDFAVERLSTGEPRLAPKDGFESLRSRIRFLGKQQPRFKDAIYSALARIYRERVPYDEFSQDPDMQDAVRGGSAEIYRWAETIGMRRAIGRIVRAKTRPYKYHFLPPLKQKNIDGWMNASDSIWHQAHRWDPATSEGTTLKKLGWLRTFAKTSDIRLVVVNLPENGVSRRRYTAANYETYRRILEQGFDGVPLLDLREMLPDHDFYDVVHTSLPAACRVTDRIVEFLKTTLSEASHDSLH